MIDALTRLPYSAIPKYKFNGTSPLISSFYRTKLLKMELTHVNNNKNSLEKNYLWFSNDHNE